MGDEQPQQPQWAVKVEEGHNPDEVAEQHGFINLGPVANLKNYFLFEARHQNKRSTQQAATVSPHRSTVRACVCVRTSTCAELL